MLGNTIRFFKPKQTFSTNLFKNAIQNNERLAYGLGMRTGVLLRTVADLEMHNAFIDKHAVYEPKMINTMRYMLRHDLSDVRQQLFATTLDDDNTEYSPFCGQRILNEILTRFLASNLLTAPACDVIESLLPSMPPSLLPDLTLQVKTKLDLSLHPLEKTVTGQTNLAVQVNFKESFPNSNFKFNVH